LEVTSRAVGSLFILVAMLVFATFYLANNAISFNARSSASSFRVQPLGDETGHRCTCNNAFEGDYSFKYESLAKLGNISQNFEV